MKAAISAGVLLAAAAPALAQEHVLFEVQGKDTVLGTIRPADEREAIVGNLVAGTVLKASGKSTQKSGPVPALQLLLDGTPVAAASVVTKGRSTTLVPFVVAATGSYKVVVAGDGSLDGDYQLAVNWTPKTAFAATGTSAGDTTFGFSVPANSVVAVTLSAAKGSPFVPHLVELDGPTIVAIPLSGARATGLVLAQRGDWTLHFKSDGAEGPYKVSVKVAPPKVAKHKADIRDTALSGAFGGGSTVYGSVVTPDDGGTVGVDGSGSPIDGSSVTVPPGSLGATTTVFVAAAEPYTPPGSDHPAGPAVEFGPSGTQFDPQKPATVTIPFDTNAFPGGTSALVVYVKDKDGVISPVLPTSSYVFGANTVTFTTSHFSTFQAATSADRGFPNDNYTWIEVSGSPFMEYDGEAGVAIGAAFVGPNGFGTAVERSSVSWTGVGTVSPIAASVDTVNFDVGAGTITQVDDSSFDLATQFGSPVGRLRRGLTNDVFVVEHIDGSLKLGTAILLRRSDAYPTLNTLAGKWNVLVWEVSAPAVPPRGGTTLPVSVVTDLGSAVVLPTGAVTFKFPSRITRSSDLSTGVWSRAPSNGGQATATFSIDNADHVTQLQFGAGPINEMQVSGNGNVVAGKFVGVDRGFGVADNQVALLVMVREAPGLSATGMSGAYADVLGALDLTAPGATAPPDPLGLKWRAQSGTTTLGIDAQRTETYRLCITTPTAFDPTTFNTEVPTTPPAKFTVAASGAFAVPSLSIAGAASPAGDFVLYFRRDSLTLGFGCALRLPGPGQ